MVPPVFFEEEVRLMNTSTEENKGSLLALLPIAVFLVVFIGSGILFQDFYAMPAVVGFLIALIVAFLQNRKRSFNDKLIDVTRSMGDENVMVMCLVFVLAGAFSGSVQAAGGVESTVNFGLSILPPSVAVVGIFVIGCFISTAMGTSVGTIAALAPIAVGISEKTGSLLRCASVRLFLAPCLAITFR